MLNAVEIARLTAIQTEVATGNVANLAEMQALLAKQVAAPAAPIAGPITSFDVALNARCFASPNATGAETAPLRSYVFAQDSLGQPKLIGGTWVAGAIVSDKYAALKDSNGAELATQPDYVGREKSIKFIITDNSTGNDYRLSASSFEAAHKAAGSKMSFVAREMSQLVAEVGGYSKAVVTLA